MRISALILGSLFALGCSSSANKKLDEFADKACACKDAECAKKVQEDFSKWLDANKDATGNEEEAKKSATRMMTCITKAQLGKAGADAMDKAMDKAKEGADKAKEAADKVEEKKPE